MTPKFKLNQTVFIMEDNKIQPSKIVGIRTRIEKEPCYSVVPISSRNEYEAWEYELFESKAALIASL